MLVNRRKIISRSSEFILFRSKGISSDNVNKFIKMYFYHSGYGTHNQTKTEGKATFTMHQDLGKMDLIFYKIFLETVIKSTLERECDSTQQKSL